MDTEVRFIGCLCITDQMFSLSPVRLPTPIITVHSNHHNCHPHYSPLKSSQLSSSLQPTQIITTVILITAHSNHHNCHPHYSPLKSSQLSSSLQSTQIITPAILITVHSNHHNCHPHYSPLKSSQLSSSLQPTQIITTVILITAHNLTTSHMFFLPFHYTSWRQQLKQSRTATHVLVWSLRHLRVKDPIKKKAQPSRSIYTTKLWKNKRKTHCERVRTQQHRFWCPPDTFWWRSLYKRTKYCRTTYRDKHGGTFYICVCSMAVHTGCFIIRRWIFLSTDETHKAFVLFSVYLDILRCFLYPKALGPVHRTTKQVFHAPGSFRHHSNYMWFTNTFARKLSLPSQNVAFLCPFREQRYGFPRYCRGRKFWSTKKTASAKNEYDVVCDVKSRASDRRQ
jgi:hypothetical protein